ncbi:MAG: PEP-CTERM sorting domain-containing protein [Burkholderiaceae bacterium]|nr:PEP-CTERM sorting domain-containing protein [Burkholderiaceae bacterium]
MKLFAPVRTAIAAAALAFGAALPASAAFYVDDTTGGPTFNRALAGFSDLSSVGTDVAYDVYAFSVAVDGLYSIRSFAEGLLAGEPWDQFLFLYAGSFDPTAPLLNGVIGNDDYDSTIGRSGFDVDLTTGTAYYLVTTGFGNDDSGRFLNVVRGPGDILPVVPEPGTYAMLAMGLFAVSLAVRRRALGQPD